MLKLFIKNYSNKIGFHLFVVLQLGIVLFLMNAMLSESIWQFLCVSYPEWSRSDFCYFSRNDEENSTETLEDLKITLQQIQKIEGVEEIGYHLTTRFQLKGESFRGFYLNSLMKEVSYPMKEGHWFKEESTKNQVVVGGALFDKYQVGDTILLEEENGEFIQKAEVIGKLKEPKFLLELNASLLTGELTFDDILFNRHNNVVFLLQESLTAKQKEKVEVDFLRAFLLKIDAKQQAAIAERLKPLGSICSLQNIKENSEKRERMQLKYQVPVLVSLGMLVLYGVLAMGYAMYQKSRENFRVYYYCGMTKQSFVYLLLLENVLDICMGVLLTGLFFSSDTIVALFFTDSYLGMWNWSFSGAYILLVLVVVVLQMIWVIRKKY